MEVTPRGKFERVLEVLRLRSRASENARENVSSGTRQSGAREGAELSAVTKGGVVSDGKERSGLHGQEREVVDKNEKHTVGKTEKITRPE